MIDRRRQNRREQRLVDAVFEMFLVFHDYRNHFEGKSREEVAKWVSDRLTGVGFPTIPVGMSWGVLVEDEENPSPVGRMMD